MADRVQVTLLKNVEFHPLLSLSVANVTLDKMKISKEIFVNVNAVKYSFCGQFLAYGFANELSIVRTFDGIMVLKVYCSGKIKRVEWSIDCDHVLCVTKNKNSVELFSISSPEWNCLIQEGLAGLLTAMWSPKGTHVVTVSEFAVRLSVWSLVGRSVAFIDTPLLRRKDKLPFSEDGNHLALIWGNFERYKIATFSTVSWAMTTQIPCTNEIDVPSNPLWSPDGSYVAIWETVDYEKSALEIYDVKTKKKAGDFNIKKRNKLGGICSAIWCPNSQFLMIGCRDDCIYVLSYITWSVLSVFSHEKVIDSVSCYIFRETKRGGDLKFLICRQRPAKFTFIRPSTQAGQKFYGIKTISISNDGVHVASQSERLPVVVWIWNLKTLSLMVIVVLKNQVTDLVWSDSSLCLLICDGSTGVKLWRPHEFPETHSISPHLNRQYKIKTGLWRPGASGDVREVLFFTSASMLIVSNFPQLVFKG